MPRAIQNPVTGQWAVAYCDTCRDLTPFKIEHPGDEVIDCLICNEGGTPINPCDWEQCFSKWGQHDGDGISYTEEIADFMREQGLTVVTHEWGLHNTVIANITAADGTIIQQWLDTPIVNGHGESDPREYLPTWLVVLLDQKFKPNTYQDAQLIHWVDEEPEVHDRNLRHPRDEEDDSDVYTIKDQEQFHILTGESYYVTADDEDQACAKVGAYCCGDPCPCGSDDCSCIEQSETLTVAI